MKATSVFFAFIILLASLLPRFDFKELMQLDELLVHYQEHVKKSEGQMDFIDFIVLHYSNKNHDQTENHDQLPFHNQQCQSVTVLHMMPELSCSFKLLLCDKPITPSYQPVLYSEYTHAIWQPPKL
jgi:hypothetical protein